MSQMPDKNQASAQPTSSCWGAPRHVVEASPENTSFFQPARLEQTNVARGPTQTNVAGRLYADKKQQRQQAGAEKDSFHRIRLVEDLHSKGLAQRRGIPAPSCIAVHEVEAGARGNNDHRRKSIDERRKTSLGQVLRKRAKSDDLAKVAQPQQFARNSCKADASASAKQRLQQKAQIVLGLWFIMKVFCTLLLFCKGVLLAPVTIVSALCSSSPPWCPASGGRGDADGKGRGGKVSSTKSQWESVCLAFDALTDDCIDCDAF